MKAKITLPKNKIRRMSDFSAMIEEYEYNHLLPYGCRIDFQSATVSETENTNQFYNVVIKYSKNIIEIVKARKSGFYSLQSALEFARKKNQNLNFEIIIK